MLIASLIVSRIGGYFVLMSCHELMFLEKQKGERFVREKYPDCEGQGRADRLVAVQADFGNGADGMAAAMRMTFGAAVSSV
jgi:hypothetical protein